MHSPSAMTLRFLAPTLSLLALLVPIEGTLAQRAAPAAPRSQPAWSFTPSVSSEAEYDDNIYLLSDSKRSKVALPSAAELVSGRYADMARAGDLVTTFRAELQARGPGLMGRKLTITPEVGYELFAWNAMRRTELVGATIVQALPRGASVRLETDLTPSTFFKNYLADAVDADNSGSITPDERVYAPGAYAEREVAAEYRFRVAKMTKSQPVGAMLQVGGGYYGRSYDAPFAARDLSGPTASLGVMLDLRRDVSLSLGYDFAALGATPTQTVMLLDESQWGVDFNGNGSTNDTEARAVEMVDHSRKEHGASLTLRVPAGGRASLRFDYAHRWRRFGSGEPYDLSNNGRRDSRHELGAGMSVKLAQALKLTAAFLMQSQSVNRAGDPAGLGDVADYTRHRTSVGLSYSY